MLSFKVGEKFAHKHLQEFEQLEGERNEAVSRNDTLTSVSSYTDVQSILPDQGSDVELIIIGEFSS